MRVLGFRHASFEDVGQFAPLLAARGVELQCVDLYAAGASPPDTANADGLLFMGGPMCANDDLPFLKQELAIMREAGSRGQPILGICLGAQLLAKAFGGRVYVGKMPEIGWYDIELTPTGAADPLLARASVPQTVFQWHEDTFDLPAGAELLASSWAYRNQAFRCGKKIYGLQFHPEMTRDMIEDWQKEAALCGRPIAPIDSGLHATPLAGFCDQIVEGWLGTF